MRLDLIPLWNQRCAALRHAGPFTVWIPANKGYYSTSFPHYVAWNGFWINHAQPFESYNAALLAMEEWNDACNEPNCLSRNQAQRDAQASAGFTH